MANTSRSATWALAYAVLGWRIYAVEQGGNRPLFVGWVEAATMEASLIGRWWPGAEGARDVGVGPGAMTAALRARLPTREARATIASGLRE